MRVARTGLILLPLLAACRAEKPAPPHPPAEAIVKTIGRTMVAPDTLPAGTIRFRLVRSDSTHNLVVFALANDTEPASLADALDQALDTPAPVTARGGTEAPAEGRDTADVFLTLAPGRYLLGCMSRGFASRRHVASGEYKVVTVVASNAEAPPSPTIELGLADFAFQAEPVWPAGNQLIKVSNIGNQDHIVLIHRIDAGHTLQEWIREEGDVPWSHGMGGVSRLSPGQSVLFPIKLEPGRYILTCLIVDPNSGNLHISLGMLREITVGATS